MNNDKINNLIRKYKLLINLEKLCIDRIRILQNRLKQRHNDEIKNKIIDELNKEKGILDANKQLMKDIIDEIKELYL